MSSCISFVPLQEGDVVIMDVDPDGAIAVLAGDKKMRSVIDNTPAGIS
jgi:ATP-dependent Clp protease ATP-binding subunit ClpC